MDKNIGMIIGGFVVLLLGLVLLDATADLTYDATNTETRVNMLVGFPASGNSTVNNQTGFSSLSAVTNYSNSTAAGDSFAAEVASPGTSPKAEFSGCSWTANLTWCPNGSVYLNVTAASTNKVAGAYNLTFNYQDVDYVNDSNSRTLVSLTTLFFAIAVMLAGVGMAFVGFKGTGFI